MQARCLSVVVCLFWPKRCSEGENGKQKYKLCIWCRFMAVAAAAAVLVGGWLGSCRGLMVAGPLQGRAWYTTMRGVRDRGLRKDILGEGLPP